MAYLPKMNNVVVIAINVFYWLWNVYLPQIAIADGERDEDDCLGGNYDVLMGWGLHFPSLDLLDLAENGVEEVRWTSDSRFDLVELRAI